MCWGLIELGLTVPLSAIWRKDVSHRRGSHSSLGAAADRWLPGLQCRELYLVVGEWPRFLCSHASVRPPLFLPFSLPHLFTSSFTISFDGRPFYGAESLLHQSVTSFTLSSCSCPFHSHFFNLAVSNSSILLKISSYIAVPWSRYHPQAVQYEKLRIETREDKIHNLGLAFQYEFCSLRSLLCHCYLSCPH